MAPPTKATLTEQLRTAEARIQAALDIHRPAPAGFPVPLAAVVMCPVCRTPYPCDTALALGTR